MNNGSSVRSTESVMVFRILFVVLAVLLTQVGCSSCGNPFSPSRSADSESGDPCQRDYEGDPDEEPEVVRKHAEGPDAVDELKKWLKERDIERYECKDNRCVSLDSYAIDCGTADCTLSVDFQNTPAGFRVQSVKKECQDRFEGCGC